MWVKETWRLYSSDNHNPWPDLPSRRGPDGLAFYREGFDRTPPSRWRNPLFMPRWASRITLELAEVRVQRLQEISEDDARAEGCKRSDAAVVIQAGTGLVHDLSYTARGAYAVRWDEINFKRAPWSSNPWIWALTFRRIP